MSRDFKLHTDAVQVPFKLFHLVRPSESAVFKILINKVFTNYYTTRWPTTLFMLHTSTAKYHLDAKVQS